MSRLLPSSLRNRLVLASVIAALTFALPFGLVAAWDLHHAQNQAIGAALRSRSDLARDEVAPDGSLRQDAGAARTDLVQVLAADGTVRSSTPALHGLPPLVNVSALRTSPSVRDDVALQHPDVDLAVLAIPVRLQPRGAEPTSGAVVVAVDAEVFNAATADLLRLLLLGLLGVVVVVAALSWVLTGRALGSVTRLTETAEAVRTSDLATGLPVPHRDAEMTRLVGALNRMLGRLHASHARELAFAAGAGHRLRTPVATLRAEAELALRESDPKEHVAALGRIIRDADQLTSIVDRMLARNRSGGEDPAAVKDQLGPAGTRWGRQCTLADVTFRLGLHDGGALDGLRCSRLVDIMEPIVDNAVRHTPAGGSVCIDVGVDRGPPTMLVVDISNDGSTVPAGLVPHLFDAWVSSRDASEAGGLGLWLARETARDVSGDVVLRGNERGGTTFRVTLPAARGPGPDLSW